MNAIPSITQQTPSGERGWDIYSGLLDQRIVMLDGEVTDQSASLVVSQLLYLASKDDEADIQLYINSPGGSVHAGMAIIDTIRYIKPDVSCIVTGLAASMGAMILTCGEPGKRFALPHAEVMIHQPMSGVSGQATDMVIAGEHIRRMRESLNALIAETCSKDVDVVAADTERDHWLSAAEALDYGLVDGIVSRQA